MQEKIFITCPSMPSYEEYIESIKPLWDTHLLTNMGVYHEQLEMRLKEYLEAKEISLMVNGHMALELAIQMMDFPEGAEIITTPFTFISTTHAIVRNRLMPVFCDVKPEDGTIDEQKIERLVTKRTVAILPVHIYGNVCQVEEIQRIANKYGLKVIYDAAHAFGVRYKGKGIANYGDASIFSFHATKVFNTIEGGAVVFSNPEYAQKLYNLKNFGIRGEETVVEIGANAKMNEFCAVMGLCNLNHIDEAIKNRKERYKFYRQKFSNIKGIRLFEENADTEKNYGYFPILVEDGYGKTRDELYSWLRGKNIYARKYFFPLTADQVCFKGKYENVELTQARKLARSVLTLPVYDGLPMKKVESIVETIGEFQKL